MALQKVNAASPLPAVRELASRMVKSGKTLEFAVVNDAGQVQAYKPTGGELVIGVTGGSSATDTLSMFGDDLASAVRISGQNQELQNFALYGNRYDPRLLYFSAGLGLLILALLYSRKR